MSQTVRRRWFARIAVTLFIVTAVSWIVFDRVAAHRLATLINAISTAGQPLTRSQWRTTASAHGTAASYIAALRTVRHTRSSDRATLPAFIASLHEAVNGPLTEPDPTLLAGSDSLLARYHDVLRLVDAGSTWSPVPLWPVDDVDPPIAGVAEIEMVLEARSITAALRGQGDEAVSAWIALVQFHRALGASDSHFSILGLEPQVPQAILERTVPSDDALSRWAAMPASYPDDVFTRYLLDVRADDIRSNWQTLQDALPSGLVPDRPVSENNGWAQLVTRPLRRQVVADTLELHAAAIEASHNTPLLRSLADLRTHRTPAFWLTRARGDGWRTRTFAATRFVRSQAFERSWQTAASAMRFRRVNGRLPASLAELGNEGSTTRRDPATNRPLTYAASADECLVYSVGADEKDDGGQVLRPEPSGQARGRDAADWGIRIRLGATRR